MTGGVTRDLKPAEKRKYKAKGELGSSTGTRVRDEDTSTGARDTSDTSRAPRYVFSFSYLSS